MSTAGQHQPWLKFFPADWTSEPRLRVCSLAARGMWMEMLCIMHEATPRGYLLIKDHPDFLTSSSRLPSRLAALCGCSLKESKRLLKELEDAGVFSRDERGIIFSRRMIRDTEKANVDRVNGRSGGNPTLKRGVNPQNNGSDKAQIPEPESKILSSLVVGSKEERPVLGNFDFASDDGTVIITAEEFVQIEKECPSIKNIRGLTRNACRSWLKTIPPGQRKAALFRWFHNKQAEKTATVPVRQPPEQTAPGYRYTTPEQLAAYDKRAAERKAREETLARLDREREARKNGQHPQ